MTDQWGAPLTGAQMKLLRAAGLPDGTRIRYCGEDFLAEELAFSDCNYYLPADHPAYTLLNAGWLDGRNVRLWFGGHKAPDDWDGGDVLFRDGRPNEGLPDIIAYIAKDEVMESDDPGTVTIAKMTEAEARKRFAAMTPERVVSELGLIKETTREERFWAQHEPEGTTVPTHIKKLVKDALEFER